MHCGKWPGSIEWLLEAIHTRAALMLTRMFKLHKLYLSPRLIDSRCVTLIYFLEKSIIIFLKSVLPVSYYVTEPSANFMDNIKLYHLNANTIMASLYVIPIFPSTDMNEVRYFH